MAHNTFDSVWHKALCAWLSVQLRSPSLKTGMLCMPRWRKADTQGGFWWKCVKQIDFVCFWFFLMCVILGWFNTICFCQEKYWQAEYPSGSDTHCESQISKGVVFGIKNNFTLLWLPLKSKTNKNITDRLYQMFPKLQETRNRSDSKNSASLSEKECYMELLY